MQFIRVSRLIVLEGVVVSCLSLICGIRARGIDHGVSPLVRPSSAPRPPTQMDPGRSHTRYKPGFRGASPNFPGISWGWAQREWSSLTTIMDICLT
ncbi:uncharacterized protein F4817DRAFT_172726 [Daldinia loculata]|uniref:uncharacterized protein n=1 Tax=Daldinia loculata TaxID=103429 RepID=UPI0020C266C0|nr:uncharacterized protein F4817DRAFT_172726 [Daldinia loculata]KAI1645425.1 hypothetical protein F4817DRAFT_172726 [Daldinia loculata]